MDLEQIQEVVKEHLSDKRFYHCKCVMERAKELAEKFGYDEEIAQKVGMAHDIAKEMSAEDKIIYAEKNNINIDLIERENPTLLHAKIGADISIKELGFTPEMGQAIRAHTTGIPDMTLLDKILFIADRTSSERGFSDIDYLNNLLDESIDKGVLYILDKKIMLQIEKKAAMHPDTIIARNYLIKNGNV